jgi:hypothetical protein
MAASFSTLIKSKVGRKCLHVYTEQLNDTQSLNFYKKAFGDATKPDESIVDFIDNDFELNLAPNQFYFYKYWE